MSLFKNWTACESGATSIEYALIAGSISIVIVAAVSSIGSSLVQIFQNVIAGF